MINEYFAYLGSLFLIASIVSYMHSTWIGEAKPNRVTFFIWALASLIATAAQLAEGVGLSTLVVFITGFGPLLILALSFRNPEACWKSDAFDYACGALALGGIILWRTTHDPDFAIVFSIMSDFLASLPTLRKIITHPYSEDGFSYFLAFIGSFIGILCVQEQTLAGYGYITYYTVLVGLLTLMIYHKSLKKFLPLKRANVY